MGDHRMIQKRQALLTARPKSGEDFVFGGGAGQFSGMSRRKAMADAKIAASNNGYDMAPWTHHDLRRSLATGMAELGIQPHIIEALFNHVSGHKGGIAVIYNRAQYVPENAQALAKWATHVLAVAKGKKDSVTPLRRGA